MNNNRNLFVSYKEATEWLYRQLPMFSRIGAAAYKPGLETTIALDNHFGNPHRKFKAIHVGGTNGKGSTSHMLASILQTAGYKTGLYTSPHLVDFRERMRINGKMIPESEVVDFLNRWITGSDNMNPSFFELTMMMAFDWFAKENVDYAVIEVGMGGRLDSTNVITPEVCVITNISPDHTQFLGDTLPKIAAEKAGIIKAGIPAIIGEAQGEIREVFARKGSEVGAPVLFAEDSPRLISMTEANDGGWDCLSEEGKFHLPLGGDYQKKNLNTMLTAVKVMKERGIAIEDDSVTKGLENVVSLTGLAGRWSILGHNPLVIADTGHNVAGISSNMDQLRRLMKSKPTGRLRIVIGFVADKAIDKILALLPRDAEYYITNASIPRALPVEELAKRFEAAEIAAMSFEDVAAAFRQAVADSSPEDIIYVGGSTFIVADFLASRQ